MLLLVQYAKRVSSITMQKMHLLYYKNNKVQSKLVKHVTSQFLLFQFRLAFSLIPLIVWLGTTVAISIAE